MAFADFHGVNTSTVSDFNLPGHRHGAQIWDERDTVGPPKLKRKP